MLSCLYETNVITWSSSDFVFKYHASTTTPFGHVLIQTPTTTSIDQRDMFSLYLFAGPDKSTKVCRKEVVFVVDISESMKGNIMEVTKNTVGAALLKLDQDDSFGIIAFNDQIHLVSSTLELETRESICNAIEWIGMNFVASSGTNISSALEQALVMFSETRTSTPIVYFITDGAVEDERQICDTIQKQFQKKGQEVCPRINTFGIGSFCNHYFLRMLAMISNGQYHASYDADSIDAPMQMWFTKASSIMLTNIVIDGLDGLNDLEALDQDHPPKQKSLQE